MATTIGTESSIQDLVTNLIYLEHDAIAAYDSTIDKLEDPTSKTEISRFRDDHQRHLAELNKMAGMLGIQAPAMGDVKQMLTTGKIALASLMGDSTILGAMKTNEDDTVAAYERASTHADAAPESKKYFADFAADERRHRAWMERAAAA